MNWFVRMERQILVRLVRLIKVGHLQKWFECSDLIVPKRFAEKPGVRSVESGDCRKKGGVWKVRSAGNTECKK